MGSNSGIMVHCYELVAWARSDEHVYYPLNAISNQVRRISCRLKGLPFEKGEPVTKNSDLVIEGFPRSGNSFLTTAISVLLEDRIRLAHHLHAAAQLKRAARLGLPAVILFREPSQAIASYMIFADVPLERAAAEYKAFYRTALSLKGQRPWMFVDFQRLISETKKCLERVCQLCGHEPVGEILDELIETSTRILARKEKLKYERKKSEYIRRSSYPIAERRALKENLEREVRIALDIKYKDINYIYDKLIAIGRTW